VRPSLTPQRRHGSTPLDYSIDNHISVAQYFKSVGGQENPPPEPCDLIDICSAAIRMCGPLAGVQGTVFSFAGRQRFVPLHVLLVVADDSVMNRLQLQMRNRAYHYQCCPDAESSVKAFELSLSEGTVHRRFDLILMNNEMPELDPQLTKSSGVFAVRRIREISRLHTHQDPSFKGPCIVGIASCEDESDPSLIAFRHELELSRLQAGLSNNFLIQPTLNKWSEVFDKGVRELCGSCAGAVREE
jgi:CheY-like chemotaxis protein